MTNTNNNGAIPSRCWCGKGIVTYVSKMEENPYRRFFRCEIGLQWVDEALLDEIERMAANQARVDEQIEDLKRSMKKTVQKEVMKYKKSLDLGCVGTLFRLLCLCSKDD
ncbi:hypothetical protein HA466_0312900 [Hirschfeldia incana]|nr:hypothetical protein HA466_0312900 [Hirschfeldia incana]